MIGEALRLIRVFHDKKLVELARELDISTSYLSEIENDKKRPNLALIEKYAEVFNTKPSSILFFSEEMDKKKDGTKKFVRENMIKFLQTVENVMIHEQ